MDYFKEKIIFNVHCNWHFKTLTGISVDTKKQIAKMFDMMTSMNETYTMEDGTILPQQFVKNLQSQVDIVIQATKKQNIKTNKYLVAQYLLGLIETFDIKAIQE